MHILSLLDSIFDVLAARANCLLDNGDLVSITSYNEYDFVKKLLTPLKFKAYAFWIGLNSRDSPNIYSWSDGSAVTTVQWLSSYPVYNRYTTGNLIRKTIFIFNDVICL